MRQMYAMLCHLVSILIACSRLPKTEISHCNMWVLSLLNCLEPITPHATSVPKEHVYDDYSQEM